MTKDEDYVILYLDANNLYGLAQSLFLPHSKYEWASKEDVKLIQMFFDARACGAEVDWDKDMKIFNEGTGLFIEADIEIPDEVKDKLENFPPAPHKAMIKEAALSEYAKKLYDELKIHYNIAYDEKDAVGRRYRRQDAIGTPMCVTIDHESLKDNSVTIRFRDSMKQIRIKVDDLRTEIDNKVCLSNWLK